MVNGGGDQSRALIGDMIGIKARNDCWLPVFARSVTPAGPYLIVADADGVAVIRRDEAEQVIAEAEKIEAKEAAKRTAFESASVSSLPASVGNPCGRRTAWFQA